MSTMTAITGTVKNGELQTTKDLALFPDGTEVIILSRADFNVIAGSDSARHQLVTMKQELTQSRAEALQLRTEREAIVRETRG